MTTRDPFNTPVTDLNLRDWAAQLPQQQAPRARASSPSATSVTSGIVSQMRQMRDAQRYAQQMQEMQAEQQEAMQAQAAAVQFEQLPTFESLVAQSEQELPRSELQRLHGEYVQGVTQQMLQAYPDADEYEVEDAILERNPYPEDINRSWGEFFGDITRAGASGLATIAAAPGIIGEAISGEESGTAAALGRTQESLAQGASEYSQDMALQRAYDAAVLDAQRDEMGFMEQRAAEAANLWRGLDAYQAVEMATSMLAPGGAGLATRGVTALATRGVAEGTRRRALSIAGAGGAAGGAAVLSGADAAQSARDAIRSLTDDEFRDLPDYAEFMERAGGDEAQARQLAETTAMRIGGAIAAPISAAFSVVPGSLDRIIASGGREVSRGLLASGARSAAIGAGEEVGVAMAGNFGAGSVDPNVGLFEDTGGAALAGALLEGGLGAGGAGVANWTGLSTPPALPQAQPVAEELIAEGGTPTPATAGTTGTMPWSLPDGSTTQLVQDETGVWSYADDAQPRDPGADAFIEASQAAAQEVVDVTDTGVAESEVVTETTQPQAETTQPQAETTQPQAETTQPQAQTTQPQAETTQPQAETTQPQAETTQPQAETTQPQAQTTQPQAQLNLFTPELMAVDESIAADLNIARTGTGAEAVNALQRVQAAVRNLGPEVRAAARTGAAPSRLGEALNVLGIENIVTDNPDSAWSQAVTSGNNPLQVVAVDPLAGDANRVAAREVLAAYDAAGIPLPAASYTATAPRYRGSYSPRSHSVSFNPNTTANTVSHEYMHGLTVRGLNELINRAVNGDQTAADTIALLNSLRGRLEQAAGQQIYGTTVNAEMLAEMVRPEMLAVAARTQVGDLPSSVDLGGGTTGDPQAALARLSVSSNASILDAIARIVSSVVQIMGGRLEQGTIADVLARAAAEVVNADPNATQGTAPTPVETTPVQTETVDLPTVELPSGIRRAALRIGTDSVRFESDIDHAAYRLAAPRTPSNAAQLMAFVQDNTGWTEAQVAEYGNSLRDRAANTEANGGVRFVPRQPAEVPQAETATADSNALGETPRVAAAMMSLADATVEQGLVRHRLPERGTPLGTQVAAGAPWAVRASHFRTALRQGLEALGFTLIQDSPGSFLVRDSGNTTRATVALSERLGIEANTLQFEAGSSMGGPFYDALYGAGVASRIPMYNGSLTIINKRRIPINRLRAILKWGSFFGDMRSAVQVLRPGSAIEVSGLPPGYTGSGSTNTRLGMLASRVAAQAEQSAPVPGPIRLREDGRFTAGNGLVLTYDELRDWSLSYNWPDMRVGGSPRAAAASPDALAMAGLIRSLAEAPNAEARQAVLSAASGLNARLFDGEGQDIFFDSDPIPTPAPPRANTSGASQAAVRRNEDGHAEGESIYGDDSELESQRESVNTVIEGIEAGRPAEPVSEWRGVTRREWRNDGYGLRRLVARGGDAMNEWFADHLAPVTRWIDSIVNRSPNVERQANDLRDAMYAAPGRRDAFLSDAMHRHGGQRLQDAIINVSNRTNMATETVVHYAGYWLTAQRAPIANQRLLARHSNEVRRAQRDLAAAQRRQTADPENREQRREVTRLQREANEAAESLRTFVTALTDPDPTASHGVRLAGGLSNAAAARLSAAVEARIPTDLLRQVAAPTYQLNAWRLALDIETGRTDAEVAARFLDQPDQANLFRQLHEAGRALDTSTGADSMTQLQSLRDQVAAVVQSNYVPLSGDPTLDLDSEFANNLPAAPNTGQTYQMEGRRSIADNGIITSLDGVNTSAQFAGWRPFQERLSALHSAMSDSARQEAGFARATRIEGDTRSVPRDAILLRRNNRLEAYTIRDPSIVGAIRKNNMDERAGVLRAIQAPTKWSAYLMTQSNIMFAPVNFIRSTWENSEILRTRDLVLEDGTRASSRDAARRMLNYALRPSVWQAVARFAAGRPDNSREGAAIRELAERGGASTYGDVFGSDRSQIVARIGKRQSRFGRSARAVGRVIDTYNRTFDLIAPVSAFLALQDVGMTAQAGASTSLNLMNFRKSGSAMALPRALYVFAQPAVTGGAAIVSSLYNRRTGRLNPTGWGRMAAYTVAMIGVSAFARSIAGEDEGGNLLQQLPEWTRFNSIPIPLAGGTATIPLAFGIPRLAWGAAQAFVNVESGEQTVGEAASTTLSQILTPSFSPLDPAVISWQDRPLQAFFRTFMPTLAVGPFGVVMNRSDFDAPIVNDRWLSDQEFRSEQAGFNTPEFYRSFVRTLRTAAGVDLTPEEGRHLIRSYAWGAPGQVLTGMVDNPHRREQGRAFTNPITSRFYRQFNEHAIRGQFYSGQDEIEGLIRLQNDNERIRAAGGTPWRPNEEERRLLNLREQWDEVDNELRLRTRRINREDVSERVREQRLDRVRQERERYQTDFVRRFRLIKGQPVG